MKSVTIRQRIAVFSVLGLFSPGCSSDSGSEMPVLTEGMPASGAGGQAAAAGAQPVAGASAGTGAGPNSTGSAGMVATTAGRTGGSAGAAAGSGAGAPAAGSGGAGAGGASGAAGAAMGGSGGSAAGAGGSTATTDEKFSFFVTSWAAMQRLSKSPNGFGGDLRYGEADGLSGADKICTEIAEHALPGSGAKGWRAFLSVTKGPNGQPVHAIDRVGEGPWYDRLGRLVAMNKMNLANQRPIGADPAIINDLPNEDGVPNHAPDGMQVDNHDILTGTGPTGQLFNADPRYTCKDWTSSVGSDGTPRVGHSWPRMGGMRPGGGFPGGGFPGGGAAGSGFVPPTGGGPGNGFGDMANWMSSLNEAGCAAGASLVEMGPPNPDIPTVGSGGGYGGIYCFALKP